jgi:serine protease SohB
MILVVVTILLILIANLVMRARHIKEHLEVEDMGKKFRSYADFLKFYIGNPKLAKKELKKRKKSEKKKGHEDRRTVFVIDFEGDIRASQVDALREKVTAVLTSARPEQDEVVVRLESPGGMVHSYGLAAAQLLRIREHKVPLTICVDKVAASGGYMMACTADKIIAAPFAVLGSIGVVAQVPNLNRLLKKHQIDYEEITAGDYKRTISLLGEITDKGRQKFIQQIEETHGLFKDFVSTYRPQLDLEKIATGEHWYGKEAMNLKLVDALSTSDEYLYGQRENSKILKIDLLGKKKLSEKIAEAVSMGIERVIFRSWQKLYEESLFKS